MSGSEDLKRLRTAFGWSQERLAEVLGKDVATISRWERGKTREPMTGTVIEAAARGYLSGRTSRIGAYAEAVITPQLKAAIDHHPGMRFLAYGEKLMLLRASQFALNRIPVIRFIIGVEMSTMQNENCAAVYAQALPFMRDPEARNKYALAKTYLYLDGSRLIGHPKVYREYIFSSPLPEIFDVSARDISREEYEAQPEKLVLVPVD